MSRRSGGKIKQIGNPSPDNTRRKSNPTTPSEQKQAIADDVEAAIYSYQPVLAMESKIRQNDLRIVLGVGGAKLKLFTKAFTNDYRDIRSDNKKATAEEKKQQPELKQVSRDTTVNRDQKGSKSNKRKPNPPKKSNRSRRK